jgi:hypothetical protein
MKNPLLILRTISVGVFFIPFFSFAQAINLPFYSTPDGLLYSSVLTSNEYVGIDRFQNPTPIVGPRATYIDFGNSSPLSGSTISSLYVHLKTQTVTASITNPDYLYIEIVGYSSASYPTPIPGRPYTGQTACGNPGYGCVIGGYNLGLTCAFVAKLTQSGIYDQNILFEPTPDYPTCDLNTSSFYRLSFSFQRLDPNGQINNWFPYGSLQSLNNSSNYPLSPDLGNFLPAITFLTPSTLSAISLSTTTNGLTSSFFSQAIASGTLQQIGQGCSTNNIFSDALCVSATYLFVPSTASLDQFTNLPTTLHGKFPFSWFYGISAILSGQSSSSTLNFTSFSIDLASTGIGSTTPIGNFLPSFSAFSSSTVMYFFPAPLWSLGQTMLSGSMWIAFMYFVFHDTMRRFNKV